MPKRKAEDPRENAYHEAGHAVIAYAVGVRFEHIDMAPNKGEYRAAGVFFGEAVEEESANWTPDQWRDFLLVTVAGDVSVSIFIGEVARRPRQLVDDESTADHCAGKITGEPHREATKKEAAACYEAQAAVIEWHKLQAERMIRSPRMKPAIRALAKELLKRERVTWDEAGAIIEANRR